MFRRSEVYVSHTYNSEFVINFRLQLGLSSHASIQNHDSRWKRAKHKPGSWNCGPNQYNLP